MTKGLEEIARGKTPNKINLALPESVDWYLNFYALKTRRPKGQLIREALTKYFTDNGYDISKIPESVSIPTHENPEYPDSIKEVMKEKRTSRTTMSMTENIDWYLKFHALKTRKSIGEIVTEALALFLVNQGCESPKIIPKYLVVTYKDGTTTKLEVRQSA